MIRGLFDHFDTVTVTISDAPRPDELVILLAVSEGGRLNSRCGQAPRCAESPNASYEIKSFAADPERNNVSAYAFFSAANTGPGGPGAPTGKTTETDYVYVMQFKAG